MPNYDVVIAGGGVVGCAAALALSNISSLKIAVLESHPPTDSGIHPSFDARVIALSKSSLDHLAAWQFKHDRVSGAAIKRIHVSDRKHCGQAILEAEHEQVDMLGKVVRLEELGLALYHALQTTSVDYLTPDVITEVTQDQDSVVLSTQSRKLSCKLLLVAEGGNSVTRSLAGIKSTQEDYHQSAVVTNVMTQLEHEHCAYERFTKHGPIAFLPMHSDDKATANKLMSVVWTCSNERLGEIMGLSDAAFLQQLQHLFGNRLGRLSSATPRLSYPLILKRSSDFVLHRCICIGNAAQSLHPIAGQGFNLGVRDVNDLLQAIQDTHDVGSFAMTQRYRKSRERDKASVIMATDVLVRTFSNHYAPLVIGRNKALSLLNMLGPVKNKFARFAMGQR